MEKATLFLKNRFFFLFSFFFLGILGPQWTLASSNLPSSLIQLPDNENAILVDKQTQTLFVYTAKNKSIHLEFKTACSTGEAAGIKVKAGDKKTPEGIYFLKDEYEDRYLTPIYGKKAFPIDYPNFLDTRAGRNGSAIWIHGTNKKLKPMDSNGCVALENNSILKLSEYVNLDSTPVIIYDKIAENKKSDLDRQKKNVLKIIDGWIEAVSKGSYHEYLSFYSPFYLPDISWWEAWLQIRRQAFQNRPNLMLSAENIGIYRHSNVYVVLLDFNVVHEGKKIKIGKRKLFFNINGKDQKIVGDIFQTAEKSFSKSDAPIIVAAKKLVVPVAKEAPVVDTINKWLHAWSSKDMKKYASFYASNFRSDGLNKKKWVARKKALAQKYNYINVSGRDFKVTKRKNNCEVSFFQDYKSSAISSIGIKTLKLVKKGGAWKIYKESWKEK